jgi:hypothetical protein
MHMHVLHDTISSMRTTVEMKAEHRSALLALAARRGEKGFSSVLAEAIEHYLDNERGRADRRKELLSLAGSISNEEAKKLHELSRTVRENWR